MQGGASGESAPRAAVSLGSRQHKITLPAQDVLNDLEKRLAHQHFSVYRNTALQERGSQAAQLESSFRARLRPEEGEADGQLGLTP